MSKTQNTKSELPQGTPVMCNGYRGAIVRHYDGNMYEIRLDRGVTCTDQFEVIQPQAHSPLPWQIAEYHSFCAIKRGSETIASEIKNGANARLIVASVNHAQALAEALRLCKGYAHGFEEYDIACEALANWEGAK